jgi:hypothetical protein
MSDVHWQADRDDAREVVRGLALIKNGPLAAWSVGSDNCLVGTDMTTYATLFSTIGPPRPTSTDCQTTECKECSGIVSPA